jgi:hypothetical protein
MADEQAACVVCGCTEDNACEGGCSWALAHPPVCDRCTSAKPYFVADDGVRAMVVGPGPEPAMGRIDGALDSFELPDEAKEMAQRLNEAYALGRRAGAFYETAELMRIGDQMATLCFDIGQQHDKPQTIEPRNLKCMYEMDRQWRQLRMKLWESLQAKPKRRRKLKRKGVRV